MTTGIVDVFVPFSETWGSCWCGSVMTIFPALYDVSICSRGAYKTFGSGGGFSDSTTANCNDDERLLLNIMDSRSEISDDDRFR